MVAIKNLVYFVAAASALVIPRDATTIAADLLNINGNVTALHTAIDNYTSGILSAIPIQTANNNLNAAIQLATTNANSSAVVASADAQKIIGYISGTVEPNIASTVQAIVAKKAQVATDNLTGLVKNALTSVKTSTDSYGTILFTKAPANFTAPGQAVLAKIDADLNSGITAFS